MDSTLIFFGRSGCGGNLGALTGRITSQGYPSRYYDDNSHCEYIIEGQEGSKLLIFFDDRFDLEGKFRKYDDFTIKLSMKQ